MLILLSPAKNLKFKPLDKALKTSIPPHLNQSEKIIKKLRKLSKKKLREMMGISEDLANLNKERYNDWSTDFKVGELGTAIHTFAGEVYRGLDASSLGAEDLSFANDHIAILSGLHGMLKPLDLMKAYRLEMGTKIGIERSKNLVSYWTDNVTERLNSQLNELKSELVINLASKEYFSVVNESILNARVITPNFKDNKNGTYKVLFAYAKLMRGVMSRFIVKNRINNPTIIKEFSEDGYAFNSSLSSENDWIFSRG